MYLEEVSLQTCFHPWLSQLSNSVSRWTTCTSTYCSRHLEVCQILQVRWESCWCDVFHVWCRLSQLLNLQILWILASLSHQIKSEHHYHGLLCLHIKCKTNRIGIKHSILFLKDSWAEKNFSEKKWWIWRTLWSPQSQHEHFRPMWQPPKCEQWGICQPDSRLINGNVRLSVLYAKIVNGKTTGRGDTKSWMMPI